MFALSRALAQVCDSCVLSSPFCTVASHSFSSVTAVTCACRSHQELQNSGVTPLLKFSGFRTFYDSVVLFK